MSQKKYMALTFDDGPSFDSTMNDMLDVLEKHKVPATFFVVGNKINENTMSVLARADKMGCQIQNHSYTHSHMGQDFSKEQIENEISLTDNAIKKITLKIPDFFRPPYLDTSLLLYNTVKKAFIGGYGCEDWLEEHSVEYRLQTMLSQAKDGCIYLLHVSENNFRTVQAVNTFIPLAKKQGYIFLTISELFKTKNIDPSASCYSHKLWQSI